MKSLITIAAVAASLSLGACTTNESNVAKASATGALAGAAIGSMSANAGKGAAIGAAAGAAGGLLYNANRDKSRDER